MPGRRRFRFRRDRVERIDLVARRVHLAEGSRRVRSTRHRDRRAPRRRSASPGVETYALNYKRSRTRCSCATTCIDLAEHADHEPDPEVRRRMLTVCVVGGGYTGVELIAELQDFFESYLVSRYRGIGRARLQAAAARGGPRDPARGASHAGRARPAEPLARGHRDPDRHAGDSGAAGAVEVDEHPTIPVGLTVWAAGVKGSPTLADLPVERDRIGRIVVDTHLQIPGHPEVYGVGDATRSRDVPEASIPVIPAALAHAAVVDNLGGGAGRARRSRRSTFKPQGMLVSLGEQDAVVEVMGLRFSGYFAWLFWNALHLYKLVGLRKQVQVALDWCARPLLPARLGHHARPPRCAVCAAHGMAAASGTRRDAGPRRPRLGARVQSAGDPRRVRGGRVSRACRRGDLGPRAGARPGARAGRPASRPCGSNPKDFAIARPSTWRSCRRCRRARRRARLSRRVHADPLARLRARVRRPRPEHSPLAAARRFPACTPSARRSTTG